MKAKMINEFKRGNDPKKMLGIGEFFDRVSQDEANGTSLRGYIRTSYSSLLKLFGVPDPGDGEKISTLWAVKDIKNRIFTIYDYKETNLYSDPLPSVKKFRSYPSYDWHIGAISEDGIDELINFIEYHES